MQACLDSGPLVAYTLEGHAQFELAKKVIHNPKPFTTEAALAVAYKTVREIEERYRTGTLTYVGSVFAGGYTAKATLNAVEVASVKHLLPKTALGTRLEADMAPRLRTGMTGAELGVLLNDVANSAVLTDPTLYYKVVRLYVDVVGSSADTAVSQALTTLPPYEMELVLAASAIGKTGKTVGIVTSNQTLLGQAAEIRAGSSVATVKTLKEYVADHVGAP